MNICTTLTKSLSPNTRNGTKLLRHFKVYIIIVTSVSTTVMLVVVSTTVMLLLVSMLLVVLVCDLREKIVIMDKLSQQEQKIIITARTQLLHMN